MKMPNVVDADRCFGLRCQSKRGEYVSPKDVVFFERMFKEYPEWYASLDHRVFKATLPFGSSGGGGGAG